MASMGQTGEVYEPKPVQVWRALMNWLGFFFQIIVQILRGAPCVAHLLSYVPLLASSSSFRPLPVSEIPLNDTSSSSHASLENGVVHDDHGLGKLTVINARLRSAPSFGYYAQLVLGCG